MNIARQFGMKQEGAKPAGKAAPKTSKVDQLRALREGDTSKAARTQAAKKALAAAERQTSKPKQAQRAPKQAEPTQAPQATEKPVSEPDWQRPKKTMVTVRLDPDVLDAMKRDGPGWQTRMNHALRQHFLPE